MFETAIDELIPLSHFELDHPQPAEGWPAFLGRQAIAFVPDDLGRDSIRRRDARRLLDEKRAGELRAAKHRQVAEAEAVEADKLRMAQIWKGVSADALPVGMSASTAMLLAGRDDRPRRRSPVAAVLDGEGMTYHSYDSDPENAA